MVICNITLVNITLLYSAAFHFHCQFLKYFFPSVSLIISLIEVCGAQVDVAWRKIKMMHQEPVCERTLILKLKTWVNKELIQIICDWVLGFVKRANTMKAWLC